MELRLLAISLLTLHHDPVRGTHIFLIFNGFYLLVWMSANKSTFFAQEQPDVSPVYLEQTSLFFGGNSLSLSLSLSYALNI